MMLEVYSKIPYKFIIFKVSKVCINKSIVHPQTPRGNIFPKHVRAKEDGLVTLVVVEIDLLECTGLTASVHANSGLKPCIVYRNVALLTNADTTTGPGK